MGIYPKRKKKKSYINTELFILSVNEKPSTFPIVQSMILLYHIGWKKSLDFHNSRTRASVFCIITLVITKVTFIQ